MHPEQTDCLLLNEKEFMAIPNAAFSISETATEYSLEITAPGLSRENFCIEIDTDIITVSAKVASEPARIVNNQYAYHYGGWTRVLFLPADTDKVLAHAKYEKGILNVRIPRGNTTGSRKIVCVHVY